MTLRIGIDLGGTKTEVVAIDDISGKVLFKERRPTPKNYDGTIQNMADLVFAADEAIKEKASVGISMPGALSTETGLVKNANSTWIIGHPIDKDLAKIISRPVKVMNDANCLALSEAKAGAGKGADVVWAVIIGTGSGSGIYAFGNLINGRHAIGGEWAHSTLPFCTDLTEYAGHECYCGKTGCIETFVSGPALEKDYFKTTGKQEFCTNIAELANSGDSAAEEVMQRYEDRLARGFAGVINVLDPDVIVLGGGVSNIERLYKNLPALINKYAFSDFVDTPILKAEFGDSSGVFGAARLWQD